MDTPKTIHQIFAEAKRKIGPVGKDSRNQQQGFNFRGIDAVVNAVAPHFDAYGVMPMPALQEIEYTTVEVGKQRTPMAHVRVKVTYQFWGPAGDHIDATVPGEAMDSGDKATAKAMSVAYRIALLQALNLPTHEADPDSQTYERSPQEYAGPVAVPPPADPWMAKVEEISTADEGARVDAELKAEFAAGRVTAPRAKALRHAIGIKVASLNGAAQ